MTAPQRQSTTERAIRAVIESWSNALRVKDAERVVAHHAKDLVQYTLAPPLQHSGAHALGRKGLQEWFDGFEGAFAYEVRDVRIFASEDVAFSHSLNRMRSTTKAGEKVDLWFRVTLGFQRQGGDWKIVHEHESVPFHMDGTFKAAVDLEP